MAVRCVVAKANSASGAGTFVSATTVAGSCSYWDVEEWETEGEGESVMGAIFSAATRQVSGELAVSPSEVRVTGTPWTFHRSPRFSDTDKGEGDEIVRITVEGGVIQHVDCPRGVR